MQKPFSKAVVYTEKEYNLPAVSGGRDGLRGHYHRFDGVFLEGIVLESHLALGSAGDIGVDAGDRKWVRLPGHRADARN